MKSICLDCKKERPIYHNCKKYKRCKKCSNINSKIIIKRVEARKEKGGYNNYRTKECERKRMETMEKNGTSLKGRTTYRKGKTYKEIYGDEKAKIESKKRKIPFPTIGKNEKRILDELELSLRYKIIRQFFIDGYFVDGYIPKLNIVIEIDEKSHIYKKAKDIKRENHIKEELNCKFVRIKDY